ncbi:FG-GAP repeat domain-containing protein [Streptomyces sp. NPDC002520]
MRRTSQRALRLASALVAAGLALTAVPTAHADDSDGLLTLTDSQVQDLEQRAQLNPYAAADGAGNTEQTTPAAGTGSGTDTGTTSGTTSGTGSQLDDAGTAAKLSVNPKSTLEGVRGLVDTTALAGAGSDYLAIGSLGNVQRLTKDGKAVWSRDNASFYKDWKVTNIRPWETEPYPARIIMGYNAVSPFTATSPLGWTTGDLTGDGVADLVFSASVGINPYRPFTSPGSTLPNGTFVTVVDGSTGRTLWSKLYAYAAWVKLVGPTLVVGDAPYYNLNSAKDANATLTGIRFGHADGKLTPAQTWTYSTGDRTAVIWGGMEDLGSGLLAVSWNKRKLAATPAQSHTLVLDTADGSVKWKTDGTLYSRQLRLDTERGRIVALEQSDLTDGVKYALAAYDPATGARTTLDTRVNALPLGMTIGDLKGDSKAEYAVSESTLDSDLFINSSSVRALDGADGSTQLWSYTIKRDPANGRDGSGIWGLNIADGRLLASMQNDQYKDTALNEGGVRLASLVALAGESGVVRWTRRGAVASPMFAQPYQDADGWHVRTTDTDENIRTYGVGSGHQEDLLPLQGDLAYAQSTDINGDGKKDLVVGGQSRGLWAYDGPSLAAGMPKLLWKTTLPGSVHRIALADTNGDGKDEILVAADTDAVVVNAATGRITADIDGNGRFVRSVTGADVDGDGKAEVVVPTDKVRVYRGSGKPLWEYGAPAAAGDVVFSDVSVADGRLYTQYNSVHSLDLTAPAVNGVALNAKDGSLRWTADPKAPAGDTDGRIYATVLRNGTFASPEIPYAHGHAVVYTWISKDSGWWTTVVEIRDGRTGEVLHTGTAGGLGTTGNWFTGPEGLVLAGTASFRTWTADGDYGIFTLPTNETGGFVTGPDGQRLLIGGVQSGVYLWDPAVLTAGHNYPDHLAKLTVLGARNYFSGDLNGDGVDEVVCLNFDDVGYDRTMDLSGGGYYLSNSGIHQLTVATLNVS